MPKPTAYEARNENPQERKRFIRDLFDSIVPTYDLLNRVLSLGNDMRWRRDMVKKTAVSAGGLVLDLCCGTGDVTRLLNKAGAETVSLDFSREMLQKGLHKKALNGNAVLGDACNLPFKADTFEAATIAFGIRNLPDLDRFMEEVIRVLKPGGKLVILELVRPRSKVVRVFHGLYLRTVLPVVGGILSGKLLAYRYLSGTVATFVDPVSLQGMLESHGFTSVTHYPKTFGAATIMVCRKGPA